MDLETRIHNQQLDIQNLEHKLNMLTYTVERLVHQMEIAGIEFKGLEERHSNLFDSVMKFRQTLNK